MRNILFIIVVVIGFMVLIPNVSYSQERSSFTVTTSTIVSHAVKIQRQAVSEISKENDDRRIRLGRGYSGRIYKSNIQSRVAKIELENIVVSTLPSDGIETSTGTIIGDERGFSIIALMGIIASAGGLFLLLSKFLHISVFMSFIIVVLSIALIFFIINILKKSKKKE